MTDGSHGGYDFLCAPVIPDIYGNCGPLGGIHAALTAARTAACLVVSCDAPFITRDLFACLLRQRRAPITVPCVDGWQHPLCGIYSRTIFPLLEDALQGGRLKVRDLLQEAGAQTVTLSRDLPFYSPWLLFNVNTREDLRKAVERARQQLPAA